MALQEVDAGQVSREVTTVSYLEVGTAMGVQVVWIHVVFVGVVCYCVTTVSCLKSVVRVCVRQGLL